MMECFQKLYPIAEILECVSYVEKKEEIVDAIMQQEKTVVIVTGMRSSGKTTAINKMTGSELWEPGNMDDDEKPLRICFEPMADDEKYQCIMAANHEWNAKDAVIYELREENIIQDGQLTREALSADEVLFLISATAPFNIDEVNLLKKMQVLNCQVVVNGIDVVKEDDKQQVIDYIAKINHSLGLPPVIIMEDEKQDFGKKIRGILPSYTEQKESREKRVDSIVKNTMDGLSGILQKQITEHEEEKRSTINGESKESLVKRVKANCYTIRTDVEDYKNKAKKKALDDLNGAERAMTAKVLKKVAVPQAIDLEAEHVYKEMALSAIKIIRDSYLKDIQKVNSNAVILNLPGWDQAIKELEKYAPLSENARLQDNYKYLIKNGDREERGRSTAQESAKILIGTGLIAGGFILAPLPTAVSIAGGVASAGVGGSMYLKKRQEEKEKCMETYLREIFSEGVANIKDTVSKCADHCYEKITELLKNCEAALTESVDHTADCDVKAERLKKASALLQNLKAQ